MDRIFALRSLLSIVDEGGFAAAAKRLGVSPPAITRSIAALEASLKTELLQRTTRSFALTEAGTRYITRIRSVLSELEQADTLLQGKEPTPSGSLRVACASVLGETFVAPALASFARAQAAVIPELILLDRPVLLENEGFDLAISLSRDTGDRPALARIPVALVASPAYLATKGRPRAPNDLLHHQALMMGGETAWFLRDGSVISPLCHGSSNRFEVLKTWCIAGLGIAVLPAFVIEKEISRNDLTVLLDGFEPKPFAVAVDTHPKSRVGDTFWPHLTQHIKQLRL